MRLFTRFLASAACAGVAFPALAGGPFSDDFESYQTGGGINGQNGWQEWCNSFGVDGTIDETYANSGIKSLRLDTGDDMVQLFDIGSGVWELTVWTFCEFTFEGGQTYIIALNTYYDDNCGGSPNWSLQLLHDQGLGIIEDQFSGNQLPLIFDEWVEVKTTIDLDNDDVHVEYGGEVLFETGPWTEHTSGGGQLRLEALDLFSSTGTMWYDDVVLEQLGGGPCVADITGAEVTFGNNEGPQDPALLEADDDQRTIAQSRVFLSAQEPNLALLRVTGDLSACLGGGPAMTITVQDQASQPNVTVRVRLVPAAGGAAQEVGTYAATFNADSDHVINVANGGDFINTQGEVIMDLRYSTTALLSPLGFEGRTDLVEFEI